MDETMVASFIDELTKISANVLRSSFKGVKPPSIPSIPKASTSMKPGKASTNYSVVHTDVPEAAYGSAMGSKSVPPPPVRT